MRKVLFVATITKHIIGFHTPYLKWFKEQGYEVHVASNGDEPIAYCDKHFNLPFERFPFKKNNLKVYNQLKEIINENNYQIIHCHTPVGGVLARLAAKKVRKNGTKVIYTAHGFHFYKGAPLLNWLIYYPIEKIMAKYTDCLITINKEDYEFAKKHLHAKKIEYVHGVGVSKSKFNFDMTPDEKNELRRTIGLKEKDFVLIQVGELNKNKNQIMAITAMKDLIKDNRNIHLLLVGAGSLENYYKEKINEYNLQHNVHMLGYRKDIPKLLKISNLLLSLSYREGLPVNVIEARMCGLPIIATNCRGSRDIANKVIEMDNVKELSDSIKLCIEGKENFIYSECNEYELENVLKNMTRIYNEQAL